MRYAAVLVKQLHVLNCMYQHLFTCLFIFDVIDGYTCVDYSVLELPYRTKYKA